MKAASKKYLKNEETIKRVEKVVADQFEKYLVKDLEHCEDGVRKITSALEVPIYKYPCPKAFWGDES